MKGEDGHEDSDRIGAGATTLEQRARRLNIRPVKVWSGLPTTWSVALLLDRPDALIHAPVTDGRPMQVLDDAPIRVPIVMSLESIQPTPLPTPGPAARPPVRAPEETQKAADARTKTPEVAPTQAYEVVRAASRAVETIRETSRSLRFESTDTGLRIEVYDSTGKLVRSIPPNEQMAQTVNGTVTSWQA
jgi:hypothetical protein